MMQRCNPVQIDTSLGKLIVSHLETEGVPNCLGTSATRCAANQWKHIWKGRRRAKRVNRLSKMNSEAQKLTMTGVHPVQVHGHTTLGASTAQVNATCKNLKMGTVMGKTQACAVSTVAWFFGERRVPQTAARVEQVSEWITMWKGFDVDTRRRIRKVWRKKAPILGSDPRRWNQATSPISATFARCWRPAGSEAHQVSGKRQTPMPLLTAPCSTRRKSSTVSPVFFGNANMEKSGWALAQCRYGERYHYRFCQEGQVSADQREFFHGCACTGLSCFWSPQRTSPTCGWLYSPSIFLCALRLEDLGHQEARIVGMSWKKTDQSHTHEGIRAPWDNGAGILGHRSSFVCPRCCHVTGYLRTKSQNALRPGCGKAVVSMIVPTANCWLPLTDREAAVTLPKKSETSRISEWPLSPCKFSVTHLSNCNASVSWEARCQADRRFHEPSFRAPSKSSAEATKRRFSKFRSMRST